MAAGEDFGGAMMSLNNGDFINVDSGGGIFSEAFDGDVLVLLSAFSVLVDVVGLDIGFVDLIRSISFGFQLV